ncbi:MAG TPA: cytosine permease [Solirubrobacteraceae bacterium]|nr:cytosine permease [Solirubrobacteraceae bacterium]
MSTISQPPIEEPIVPTNVPRGIEANGINTIREEERKGHPRDLFLPWFASNVGVFGISYGAYILGDGLSLAQSLIAGFIGVVGSFLLVGIVALAGPRGSAPTQIVSRAAFGVRGNRISAILAWLLTVGWEIALVVIGTLAFATACNKLGLGDGDGVKAVGIAIITGLTLLGGITGFDLIMRMQGLITVVGAVLTVVVMALTASHIHLSTVTAIHAGSTTDFIGGIVLAATGFGLGWVYAGADYSRYLPRNASRSGIVGWTTIGGALGPVVLLSFGMLLAGSSASLSKAIGADPVGALTNVLPHWFLVPFIVLTVLGLVAATVMDVYSSGLNLQSAGLRLPRHLAASIDGTLMTLGSIYVVFIAKASFLAEFEGFLITLGVPIAAWCGVFLADVALRRRDYAETDLYNPRGRYGDLRAWPLALLAIGTAVGWGLVTNSAAGWLNWQGYLLGPLGFGGKTGAWAYSSIGVVVAIAIGFVGTLLTRSEVRRQEALPLPSGAAAPAPAAGGR